MEVLRGAGEELQCTQVDIYSDVWKLGMSSIMTIFQKLLGELLIRTAGAQCLSSSSKLAMRRQETEDEREGEKLPVEAEEMNLYH